MKIISAYIIIAHIPTLYAIKPSKPSLSDNPIPTRNITIAGNVLVRGMGKTISNHIKITISAAK